MAAQALNGLKVLDLGWHIAGPYCTKFLADYGAEVIKVERPDSGDPARKAGPFPSDEPNQEASGLFIYLNNNKKSIILDLKTESGIKDLKELVKWADILVENFSPRVMPSLGLDYETLKTINPRLAVTSISNFGQTGLYRDYKATDIVLQAIAGFVLYRGDPQREPVKAAGILRFSEFVGGAYAALAAMSALTYQRQTRIGQHVDISIMETVIQLLTHPWLHSKFPLNIWPPIRYVYTPGIEECKDGYIGVNLLTGQHWVDCCKMMEMYDWVENEDYAVMSNRLMRSKEVKDRMRPWLMARTRKEILEEGIAWRIPASPVCTPEDVVKSEHHHERGYLVKVEHPIAGKIIQPGAPVRMAETPWQLKTPAPMLGQHNKEILKRLGTEIGSLKAKELPFEHSIRKKPLEGIRICDLTRFWAGPHCTAFLGGLGAEVIKVEAIQSVDGYRWPQIPDEKWWERNANWCAININKRDFTLDLNQPRGVELFKELVKKSDVLIENFPPRVMENFNLGYPIMKDLKEDIIMVSMPGYGLSGPWRDFSGFAFSFEQTSSLAHLTGYSDGEPMNLGAAADPLVGTCAAFSILAALEFHRQTGKGQFIELAQLEALTSFAGPAIIDYVMNNRVWGRCGNHNPVMAPHNIYPCKKNDTWVAIAVRSDNEWQAFCEVIGNPQWAQEGRFSTLRGRIENQEELDRLITEWTVHHEPYELMHILQKTGVPAGAVTDPTKLDEEPHLRERGFWIEIDRIFVGKYWYASFPVTFSETPMRYRAAPTLGQDNEYVLGSILGLSKTDIEELETQKIIGTEPLQTGLAM